MEETPKFILQRLSYFPQIRVTKAGLAQLVERVTAERELVGSIPGARPLLRVLK